MEICEYVQYEYQYHCVMNLEIGMTSYIRIKVIPMSHMRI